MAPIVSVSDTEAATTNRPQGALDHGLLEAVAHEFFNSSPDGVLFVGRDGFVLTANRTQARLQGCDSPDELIGVHVTELVVPSDRDRARLTSSAVCAARTSVPPSTRVCAGMGPLSTRRSRRRYCGVLTVPSPATCASLVTEPSRNLPSFPATRAKSAIESFSTAP